MTDCMRNYNYNIIQMSTFFIAFPLQKCDLNVTFQGGSQLDNPGDQTVSKRPGTSSPIKINFSIQTNKFLIKYNLVCFQISSRLIISFTRHDYYVSTSFIQEIKRYKCLKIWKWISIWSPVPGLLLTVRSDRMV